MLTYKIKNEEAAKQCNQRILHRDNYCGDNITNIKEYARQRVILNPNDNFYRRLMLDLEAKSTDKSFIGIWQWHSFYRIGGTLKVQPFFEERVHIYNGGDGAKCYAQSAYFLLEDTGIEDATKRPIYKDLFTGKVFCFGYQSGTPSSFASTWTEEPK